MHPQGDTSMVASRLSCGKALVGTGWPICVLSSWQRGLRNNPFHLVGPPFPAFSSHFSAMMGWHLLHGSLD